jgi:hypothetical protein
VVVNPSAEDALDDDDVALCVQTAIPCEVVAAAEQAARERAQADAAERAARELALVAEPVERGAVELTPTAVARGGGGGDGGEASGSSLGDGEAADGGSQCQKPGARGTAS